MREESSSAHTSLSVKIQTSNQNAQKEVMKQKFKLFATQVQSAKCDTSCCLNLFNTGFMPSLSYLILTTQFSELEWNKIISSTICVLLNADGMVKTLAHAVPYALEKNQGLGVKNSFLSSRNYLYYGIP